MATYVMLSTLSESGRKVLRERPGQYAVLGPYDFVSVIEAPDNATSSRVSVELGARGGAAGMTMAAIPLDEFIAQLEGGRRRTRQERKRR